MRILLVDDDDIMIAILENTLTRAGYDVEIATDGREALEKLRRGVARLVVTDWEMPVMNGLELCEAVRGGEFDGYIYMILLTARSEREEIVTGMSAGADDFIAKPFDPAELLVRIRAGERILSLETRDLAIFALAKLAESRDSETGHHLERVQWYSRALTKRLAAHPKFQDQVDADFVRLIFLTSPLHDIGKVGIPDGVLRKPGRLTPEEIQVMRTHPHIGAETLDAALAKFPDARFLQIARDITATHHERWNGAGYPAGLKGEAIPLCGRIVALADVYDALTSRRCYKEPIQHELARELIVRESGKHFDPDIVDAFLAAEDEFLQIFARFTNDEDSDETEEASLFELATL